MKKALLGIVSLALALGTAQARIGETEEATTQRYNEAGAQPFASKDELGDDQLGYRFRDFTIVVSFENGTSVCESFFKRSDAASATQITAEEIVTILAANCSEGATWRPVIDRLRWESSDKQRVALHLAGRLQIGTIDYVNRIAGFNKAQTSGKLSGF